MPELKDILSDPDFKAASPETKRALLMKYDPEFAAAPPDTQNSIVGQLSQPAGGMLERAYSSVAQPVTAGVSKAVEAVAGLGDPKIEQQRLAGGGMPVKDFAEGFGRFVVPQTPAQAAMMAVTPMGGSPLMRIGLGTAAGAAGGAVGPEGAVGGATQGLVGSVAGETIGKVLGVLSRMGPGAKGSINQADTKAVIGWMEDTIPALRGKAVDAQKLQELAKGGSGRELLGEYFRTKMAKVERQIGNRLLDVPSLESSRLLTLQEATSKLADLGHRGFGGAKADPNARTIVGREARELWAKAVQEMEGQIQMFGGPKAVSDFLDGRSNYSKGLSFLGLLRKADAFTGHPSRVDLNTRALQTNVTNKQSMLENRLEADEFAALVDTVFRGGKIGTKDRLVGGPGGATDALRDVYGRGVGGAPQIMGSLMRTVLPNFGSQYAGDVSQRSLIGPSAGFSSILDLIAQRLAAQQGLTMTGAPLGAGAPAP